MYINFVSVALWPLSLLIKVIALGKEIIREEWVYIRAYI